VELGPREISICHPDAIMDVHGPRSKIRKGEFYDQNYPHQSLQMTRDPVFHHKKRRVWDRMFSTKGKGVVLRLNVTLLTYPGSTP
jgi:cytochrome P450 family 628